jgi:hypothetical protein
VGRSAVGIRQAGARGLGSVGAKTFNSSKRGRGKADDRTPTLELFLKTIDFSVPMGRQIESQADPPP